MSLAPAPIICALSLLLGLQACASRMPPAEPAGEDAVPAWPVPEGLPSGRLTCTSPAHPLLRYEGWRRSGGAMPERSAPMSGETWTWDAVIVYSSQRRYSGEESVSGALSWSWQHDAAALIEQVQQPMGRATVYTTAVTLRASSGEPLAPGLEATLTTSLTCTREEVWGIP